MIAGQNKPAARRNRGEVDVRRGKLNCVKQVAVCKIPQAKFLVAANHRSAVCARRKSSRGRGGGEHNGLRLCLRRGLRSLCRNRERKASEQSQRKYAAECHRRSRTSSKLTSAWMSVVSPAIITGGTRSLFLIRGSRA